jgi:hypothetical protein
MKEKRGQMDSCLGVALPAGGERRCELARNDRRGGGRNAGHALAADSSRRPRRASLRWRDRPTARPLANEVWLPRLTDMTDTEGGAWR